MDSFNDIWKEVLAGCRSQISDVMYNMWLAPLEFVKFENDTVIFLINADFKKTIILEKFSPMIKEGFENILGFPVNIDIFVEKNLIEQPETAAESSEPGKASEKKSPYALYTFDNFIVGKSNAFAYNMALGVAADPGTKYNPLLLYGSSGLGKTHLMFAVYNKMKENDPDSIIIYTTAENFLKEMIECISTKNMTFFHNKYRNADALLIDDIQYIQTGKSVQEEFFHTFNVLHEAGKQIVLTSDVPPRELEGFDERLRTRFEMGVIADIQPPDIDTRRAIIMRKCRQLGFLLNDQITDFLASKIKNNVRQLEGSVKKLEAMTQFYGSLPDMDTIREMINEMTTDYQPVSVVVEKILQNVAETFGVSVDDIKSDKRQANITQARQAAMYAIKEVTQLTLKEVGAVFGKNHATVLHSVNACAERMKETPSYKATINDIIRDFREKE